MKPAEWHYAPAAVALHWLLAALILCQVGIGLYMMSIEDDPGADAWFNLHKSVGITIFALVLVRACWRLTHRPAALPASVAHWETVASTIVQWLLYAGMLILPITGFVGASYLKSPIVFFGHPLPPWRAPDKDTAEAWFAVHVTVVWIMVGLVALHALAGLKHAFVDRDRVLQRMWF
jgi:cytochrome b561